MRWMLTEGFNKTKYSNDRFNCKHNLIVSFLKGLQMFGLGKKEEMERYLKTHELEKKRQMINDFNDRKKSTERRAAVESDVIKIEKKRLRDIEKAKRHSD